ncbi:MAG TPA: pentapeptide repeat-containing protein [Ktedonobacterales bacterium]|nr:pentapeptide repeat-containing protein [Ktedonobacterales bacterium]
MGDEPERWEADVPRPDGDDPATWRAFWRAQGQSWRSEPEVSEARLRELARARDIHPDIAHGIYPFAAMRLSRADVEWLLATHDGGRGPVNWSDSRQRGRDGLDLRGADLHDVDLSGLPLARLRGGLSEEAWRNAPADQLATARPHLERALLTGAHLEGAILEGAHLEEAKLGGAHLEQANLSFGMLEGAYLPEAHLEAASLVGASLAGANLNDAHLEGAALRHTVLSGAELFAAHLEGAKLRDATLAGQRLSAADLARLRRWRPDFPDTLPGAFLGGAFLDPVTSLDEAILSGDENESVSLADLHWGGVNLAVVDWVAVRILGDEAAAWREAQHFEKAKADASRLPELRRELLEAFRIAVRANRQLAVALRDQGLSEEADRYSYRAQKLNREVLWRQALWGISESQGARRRLRVGQRAQKLGAYLFSHFLDGLSGYGYRPGRSLAAYVLTLVVFCVVFFVLGRAAGTPLSWIGAAALSINSFHGRGFFPGTVTPGDPVTIAAAVEAIVGLIIELSFIATFTQRYFGR